MPVRIAVTGSIATDHLMTFDGLFSESLLPDQLDKVSLSFLVGSLDIRRGGIAANISFGLARLGLRPLLVDSVGRDFADYRSWLECHGVDCSQVRYSETEHTARFVCTTDRSLAQIASFYTGAMADSRLIELGPLHAETPLDLVVIGAGDPEGMARHTDECRQRGIPFAADPSQQLAYLNGAAIRHLVDGADYLFTNEYESHLTESKTGWDADEIARRVRVRVITRGKDGALIAERGKPVVEVEAALTDAVVDPTGVGDAFRAGFLAGVAAGLGHERSAQLGSMLATHVLETTGTQEYTLVRDEFLARLAAHYGPDAADEIGAVVVIGAPVVPAAGA